MAFIFFVCVFDLLHAQELTVTSVSSTGLGISNFESKTYSYDFVAPVESNWLCKNGYQSTPPPGTVLNEGAFCLNPLSYSPSSNRRYFMSVFGPRMRANSPTIDAVYDYHQGEDIVYDKNQYATPPDIICMCDGKVKHIENNEYDSQGKLTQQGKYVTVECDRNFSNAAMGKIYISYRHLESIHPSLVKGASIKKKDIIGVMGETGITTTVHLHLSVQKMVNGELINVHPMRIFNPDINRHLLAPIDAPPLSSSPDDQKKERVNIFLLRSSLTDPNNKENNWGIFRIAVPYKKANIRAVVIKKGLYSHTFDLEKISEDRDNDYDSLDYNVVGNMELFAFPFNRYSSAYTRFTGISDSLAIKYPFHTGNLDPIKLDPVQQTLIFSTPAYVLDIKVKGVPLRSKWEVYVIDIWGNAVKGTL